MRVDRAASRHDLPAMASQEQQARELRHYWSVLTTAGRAAEGLRAAWREQLRFVQERVGFSYIRFHGLFHDEMMIYRENEDGSPGYNWTYLDDLFDFLLSIGLRPFVELGFTPEALASGEETVFFWQGNITPPRDYGRWADLVTAFVRHCIDRYGLAEVRQWYFEVWNEPNLGGIFWTGGMEKYLELYAVTARAVRAVDDRLRVGGPATSNFTTDGDAPWFREFSEYCSRNELPVDFFSCHPYPNTWSIDTEGNQLTGYRDRSAARDDLSWLARFRDASCAPEAEIHLTEWNSSPSPRDLVHDTCFMVPFVIESYVSATGLADSLGYWAFTDLFEENGLGDGPFHGGFGLLNVHGIPKPAFHAFEMLSRLGDEELARGDGWIATRDAGGVQLLFWNYAHYTPEFAAGDRSGLLRDDRYGAFCEKPTRRFRRDVREFVGSARTVTVLEVNRAAGSAYDAWVEIGAPEHLSRAQERYLRARAEPVVRRLQLEQGALAVDVPAHGAVFVELRVDRPRIRP